jgi:hypothetical protein
MVAKNKNLVELWIELWIELGTALMHHPSEGQLITIAGRPRVLGELDGGAAATCQNFGTGFGTDRAKFSAHG